MSRRVLGLGFALAMPLAAALADPSGPVDPARAELGYAIGYRLGRDFRGDPASLDVDALLAGLRDAAEGASPRWTEEEMRAALRRLEEARRRDGAATAATESAVGSSHDDGAIAR